MYSQESQAKNQEPQAIKKSCESHVKKFQKEGLTLIFSS